MRITNIIFLLLAYISLNAESPFKYDSNGYDSKGFDRDGYDFTGYNSLGTNRQGYNQKGQKPLLTSTDINNVLSLGSPIDTNTIGNLSVGDKIYDLKITNWNSYNGSSTITYAKSIKTETEITFIFFVGFNGKGEKGIFINQFKNDNSSICDIGENTIRLFGQHIAYFNNQAIKMNVSCMKNEISDRVQYGFVTDKGMNYVVKLLKKSYKPIRFQVPSYDIDIKFSAKGFSKSWKDIGRGAL